MRRKVGEFGIKSEAKVKCKRMSMENRRRKVRKCLVAKNSIMFNYLKKN
jgi:hypothetical protein